MTEPRPSALQSVPGPAEAANSPARCSCCPGARPSRAAAGRRPHSVGAVADVGHLQHAPARQHTAGEDHGQRHASDGQHVDRGGRQGAPRVDHAVPRVADQRPEPAEEADAEVVGHGDAGDPHAHREELDGPQVDGRSEPNHRADDDLADVYRGNRAARRYMRPPVQEGWRRRHATQHQCQEVDAARADAVDEEANRRGQERRDEVHNDLRQSHVLGG
mmetsp:Transcript_14770/g.46482  ORF Transcript_14770/g.46482 Transcript_14770/m.46482 type:complete len:218 (+) Transcript_14770:332-985(+)